MSGTGAHFKVDSMASILVTGASGFIGGRLVSRLIEQNFCVWCLVRANSRVDDLRSAGAHLIVGDMTDRGCVERALIDSRAGALFHLAGLLKARSRDDFTRVNGGGVEAVAAACARCVIPPVLVVVSSLAAAGPCEGDRLRVESDFPKPVSNY